MEKTVGTVVEKTVETVVEKVVETVIEKVVESQNSEMRQMNDRISDMMALMKEQSNKYDHVMAVNQDIAASNKRAAQDALANQEDNKRLIMDGLKKKAKSARTTGNKRKTVTSICLIKLVLATSSAHPVSYPLCLSHFVSSGKKEKGKTNP
ncbi:MAG: hypothetical protein LC687_02965 [Actinobacteria bacterium]|nr:hypothetical protein [Actinomycetota bacterium]